MTTPRSFSDYEVSGLLMQSFRRLSQASVVWADYEALQEDFPSLFLNNSGDGVKPVVDNWLIRNCAIISESQLRSSLANSPISARREIGIEAARPPGYGRAAITEVEDITNHSVKIGLVDVKGCGVSCGEIASNHDHSNGLMTLNEAFGDLIYQRLIEKALAYFGVDVIGVPIYAIISLSFGAYLEYSGPLPAALMLRQAHFRAHGGVELPDKKSEKQIAQLMVELILRSFGLTSASPQTKLELRATIPGAMECIYGGKESGSLNPLALMSIIDHYNVPEPWHFDCLNIQTARDLSIDPLSMKLVDFGHYRYCSKFHDHIISLVRDRPMNFGGLVSRDDPRFIQPLSDLCLNRIIMLPKNVSTEILSWGGFRKPGKLSAPRAYALDLAYGFTLNKYNRDTLSLAINSFVETAFYNQHRIPSRASK